jgi:hypothetical protein
MPREATDGRPPGAADGQPVSPARAGLSTIAA